MIFPIGDTQVKGGHKPIVSYSFIAINIIVFLGQMLTPGNLVCELSAIPADILSGNNYHTLLSSMFLHGGIMHIVGNLLFLWIFADNIEATIGSVKFFIFYIAGGVAATYAHIYFGSPSEDLSGCCLVCSQGARACGEGMKACSNYIPMLGASGAISAVMGAYLVMFPKSQIKILVIFLFRSFYMSAWIFLVIWFAQQLFSGIGTTTAVQTASSSGVAWWAHIGGFVFGLALGFLFKNITSNRIRNPKDFV